MIEVELPDGSVAEFPDGTPPEAMKRAIQKRFPPEAATTAKTDRLPASVTGDVLRSGATGLREGAESTAGMFGDAGQMQGNAFEQGARKLGLGDGASQFAGHIGRLFSPMGGLPGTEEIRSATTPVVEATGMQDVLAHEPQTTAGKYARTAGQFAPAALSPGSLARRTAMVAAPAVASETAGQLTEGTELEPHARFVGGLAAGGLAAGRRPKATNIAAKGAPSRAELKAATDATYGQLRSANIRYDNKAFGQAVLGMASEFRKRGFRPSIAKDAYNVIEELAQEVGQGRAPDFDDINGLAQAIGGKARAAMRAGDNTLAEAYGIVRDHLDDFERVSPMTSGTGMPPAVAQRLHGQARTLALRNIKARTLEAIVANADTYAAGQEAGIRNGINNLLRSKKGIQLFKGDERKALLEVAQGRKALRTLSRFGFDITKLSGNATALPTIGALGAGMGLSPIAGAGLALAGTAAKALSPAMTNRSLEKASAAIRSGRVNSPQVQKQMKAQQLERIIRAVIAGEAARGSAAVHSRP